MEQQIEQPFKSLHIDEQRRFLSLRSVSPPQRFHRHERAVFAVCVCSRCCKPVSPADKVTGKINPADDVQFTKF